MTFSSRHRSFAVRRVAAALGVTLAVWTAIAIARSAYVLRPGLRAQYFATVDWTGAPVRTLIDPTISTLQLSRSWGYLPPDTFSAQWSGFLFVPQAGTYTLQTTSDDGSLLYVDGRLVVDNGGLHGARTRTGRVAMARGPHAIVLQYLQAGVAYELEWAWARDDEPPSPIPDWLLSHRPRTYAALVAIRWLDRIGRPLLVLAVLLACRLAFLLGFWPTRTASGEERDAIRFPFRRRRAALALALFLALAIVQTWPLATNPAHLSRNDTADTILNEWTLAWNAHQLLRHPLKLFDGNMFYPERLTVAYSEALLVQSAMAAPMLWLGASPILAYNLVLVAGFALTGWAMCLVVSAWTKDWSAGVVAGMIVAFNAHTLTRLPHLQAQHAEFLPFVLWTLDAVLRRPRVRSAVWLAIWFTLQALASVHLLVFTTIAIVVSVLVRPEDWLGARLARLWPALLLFVVIAGTALAPALAPYWLLHGHGFTRSLDEAAFFAATVRDYMTSVARLDGWAPVSGSVGLYPGTLALALAGVALVSGVAFRDARARMCLAFGICGVALSFGPAVAPGYETLYFAVPLLQGIRTASRFGYLGIVAVAVLGGYGLAWTRHQLASHVGWQRAATGAAVAMVFAESVAAPISYAPFTTIPSIYALPAVDARAVVVEMPMAPPAAPFFDAPDLLNSTLNWRPLINGYSGFTPPSYEQHYAAMRDFPSQASVAALQAAGVSHVFVHLDRFDASAVEAIGHAPALHRVAMDGSIALYRLDRLHH